MRKAWVLQYGLKMDSPPSYLSLLAIGCLISSLAVLFLRTFSHAAIATLINLLFLSMLLQMLNMPTLASLTMWILGGGVLLLLFTTRSLFHFKPNEHISRKYYIYKLLPVSVVCYLAYRMLVVFFTDNINTQEPDGRTLLLDDLAVFLNLADFFVLLMASFIILRREPT